MKLEGRHLIAVDCGASGGKMAAAAFDGNRLLQEEYLTFPCDAVKLCDTLYWDVFGIYRGILNGLRKYAASNIRAGSVGIDTWGATYGLLDGRGRLLEPVYHYRDSRTEHIMEPLFETVSRRELFRLTGCQCNRTYTLPQLYSCVKEGDACLNQAKTMLFLPDLLGYFLSGEISTEMTIAGTSALMRSDQEDWSREVFKLFGIPEHFLTPIVDAGTVKGRILRGVAEETGQPEAKLAATIGHDSAAAVAAIPGFGYGKLYISIGTNVSMGVELDQPAISEAAFLGSFKNTGGLGRKKIVYKDFSAFWFINGLRASWRAAGMEYGYDELHELALKAKSPGAFIDLEDAALNSSGGDMRQKISSYFAGTNQPVPDSAGEWALCVFESIALNVKRYADYIRGEMGIPLKEAFVINGGSRNSLLVKLIADALGLPVKAGMPYASLAGNLLGQLLSVGEAAAPEELREISANTFSMTEYHPSADRDWAAPVQAAEERARVQNPVNINKQEAF